MNVISTSTVLYKRVLPVFFIVIVLVSVATIVAAGVATKIPAALLGPVFMTVVLVIVLRVFVWDLADEVRDGGSFLVVRRGSIEERVALADVLNVSMTQFVNPPRLSLRLRKPCRFGDEVAFIPKQSLFRAGFRARNPIAEDLIARVDRARRETR